MKTMTEAGQPLHYLADMDEINRCFYEADRLEQEARLALSSSSLTVESIENFSAAKLIADGKYAEAHIRWDLLKNRMPPT